MNKWKKEKRNTVTLLDWERVLVESSVAIQLLGLCENNGYN